MGEDYDTGGGWVIEIGELSDGFLADLVLIEFDEDRWGPVADIGVAGCAWGSWVIERGRPGDQIEDASLGCVA